MQELGVELTSRQWHRAGEGVRILLLQREEQGRARRAGHGLSDRALLGAADGSGLSGCLNWSHSQIGPSSDVRDALLPIRPATTFVGRVEITMCCRESHESSSQAPAAERCGKTYYAACRYTKILDSIPACGAT